MYNVIDLGPEYLIDRSQVPAPQLRLLLLAVGRPLVAGSQWVVVDKRVAAVYSPLLNALRTATPYAPAA